MEIKAKTLNCLSSYEGLNRFSLGQISELLRLTKESYCNLKLKCPDAGKHTVMCHEYLVCQTNQIGSRDIFVGGILWPTPRLEVQSKCPATLTNPTVLYLG